MVNIYKKYSEKFFQKSIDKLDIATYNGIITDRKGQDEYVKYDNRKQNSNG